MKTAEERAEELWIEMPSSVQDYFAEEYERWERKVVPVLKAFAADQKIICANEAFAATFDMEGSAHDASSVAQCAAMDAPFPGEDKQEDEK